jgi:protein TonB
MTFKKTITISIVFHICLLSAALLFSAGLFKGSGNSPDEKVFFVKLAVESNQANNNEFISEKKESVPKKVVVVKQKKKHQVVTEQPPEIVKPEVALEKAPEPLEAKTIEDDELLKENLDKVRADEDPVPDNSLETYDDQEEIVQASLASPVSESKGLRNGSARSGLSPAIIDFIGNAIERAKTYPVLARKRGMEGTVYVSFRINKSGSPDEIEILKSSGHRILDSATVKVIKKAGPYPHIKNRVEVPVAYRLRK